MLVFTRRQNDEVIIEVGGKMIRVVVTQVRPNGAVRLAFDADPDVTIDRREIWEAKLAAEAMERR